MGNSLINMSFPLFFVIFFSQIVSHTKIKHLYYPKNNMEQRCKLKCDDQTGNQNHSTSDTM